MKLTKLIPSAIFGALLAISYASPVISADEAKPRAERSKDSKDSGLSRQDKKFAEKAAAGGHAEVATGKLAASQGSNDQIKKFGEQMVADHTKAGDELKQIASGKGLTLPEGPDKAHQKEMEKMQKLSGEKFDRRYIEKAGVEDHKTMEKLFKEQINDGKDADLKAFAQKTLPVVQHHLKMARDTQKAIKNKK